MSIERQNKYSVGGLVVLERIEVFSEYVLYYDDGSCERFTYDKWGNRNRIEDRNGNKSDSTGAKIVYYYDRKDQVVLTRQRIFEDAYKETRYEYSKAGRLLKEMVCLREVKEILSRNTPMMLTKMWQDRERM